MKKRENKILPVKRRSILAENYLGKRFRERQKCLERERPFSIKRDRMKLEKISRRAIYRNHESEWIGRYREVSRFNFRQMELSRGVHCKVTLMDRTAIENLSSKQNVSRWIENLSRSYRDKFSKALMDQNSINFYRERKIKRLDR